MLTRGVYTKFDNVVPKGLVDPKHVKPRPDEIDVANIQSKSDAATTTSEIREVERPIYPPESRLFCEGS